MPADITVPWIDPLKLIDAYARIVLKPDSPGFMLCAPVLNQDGLLSRMMLKGTPRADWIECFAPNDERAQTPHAFGEIVTFVPSNYADTGQLSWVPLRMGNLRAWAEQLDALKLDPFGDNTATFAAMQKQLVTDLSASGRLCWTPADRAAYPMNFPTIAMARGHKTEFLRVLNALRHPMSALIDLNTSPEDLTRIIRPDLVQDDYFYPMCSFDNEGTPLRMGHSRNYGAVSRQGWRRVQHHGLRPDVMFFGKEWMVEQATPNALFAGVEMEMELANSQQRQRMLAALFSTADELGQRSSNRERLHVEQDGSIAGHGVEVVLMPHEIHSYHGEMFWRKMWRTALAGGASNVQRTCGMHIHISARSALAMPRSTDPLWPGQHAPSTQDYQDTVGLLIDLVTGMLIGGPELYAFDLAPIQANPHGDAAAMFSATSSALGPRPTVTGGSSHTYGRSSGADVRTEERFATQAFGRPARWGGDYAATFLHLMRKRPNTPIDRYRHVNWNNRNTIEFRIFGPHDYSEHVDDWVNVATQMCSAIVHFSRATALHVLRKGCQAADARLGVERVLALMPRWLQPILRLNGTRESRRHDQPYLDQMSIPRLGNQRYAFTPPPTAAVPVGQRRSPWMIGMPWCEQRHQWGSYLYDSHWAGSQVADTALRGSELYAAMLLLWRRFGEFLNRQAPQYALLQAHLQPRVFAKLPTAAQQAQMLHAGEPVRRRPAATVVTTDQRVVDETIAALGLEDSRSFTSTTTANLMQWFDTRTNLPIRSNLQ